MKKVIAITFTLIALALTSFAQKDEEVSVTVVTQNLGKSISPNNLGFGFGVGYAHCFGRKGGRGDVCAGVELSSTFNGSNLSLIRGGYFMKYQRNGNDKFQPYVKGSLELACDHWRKKGANSPTNTGCPALSPGVEVGVDIPVKKGSRTAVRIFGGGFTTNFRNPAKAYQRETQINVEAGIGLRF